MLSEILLNEYAHPAYVGFVCVSLGFVGGYSGRVIELVVVNPFSMSLAMCVSCMHAMCISFLFILSMVSLMISLCTSESGLMVITFRVLRPFSFFMVVFLSLLLERLLCITVLFASFFPCVVGFSAPCFVYFVG